MLVYLPTTVVLPPAVNLVQHLARIQNAGAYYYATIVALISLLFMARPDVMIGVK